MTKRATCAGKKRRKKFMARPTGLQSKLKDNSKRNYRAREEQQAGKKLGRKKQLYVSQAMLDATPEKFPGHTEPYWEKV
jgi:hypothetical protein